MIFSYLFTLFLKTVFYSGLTFHSGMASATAPLDTLSRDPAFHTSIFILHADRFRPASSSYGKRLQLPTSLRRVGQHPSSLSSPRLATSSPRSPYAPQGRHALTPKRLADTPARTSETRPQPLTRTPAAYYVLLQLIRCVRASQHSTHHALVRCCLEP